ncbi:unnamed protein product [Gongylonema pulchrum]|uniref:Ovule protein n=1 Tax=Gongylonema pulchrum TaxID=637853 RepID=A0A183DY66_9BILA|nr:unnamed protein product [Gongylonema pulchrum]
MFGVLAHSKEKKSKSDQEDNIEYLFVIRCGMADSSNVLKNETSELELIEEDLVTIAASSGGSGIQQHLPRFSSAAKTVIKGKQSRHFKMHA